MSLKLNIIISVHISQNLFAHEKLKFAFIACVVIVERRRWHRCWSAMPRAATHQRHISHFLFIHYERELEPLFICIHLALCVCCKSIVIESVGGWHSHDVTANVICEFILSVRAKWRQPGVLFSRSYECVRVRCGDCKCKSHIRAYAFHFGQCARARTHRQRSQPIRQWVRKSGTPMHIHIGRSQALEI